MKFLFDLDETLYVGDIVMAASCSLVQEKKIRVFYSGKNVKTFPDMDGIPDIVKERCREYFRDPFYGATNKTPLPGSYMLLKLLHVLGHKIGTLTARPKPTHDATLECLRRDFPDIPIDAMFANIHDGYMKDVSKVDLLAKWEPDYYFDDHLDYCVEAHNTCPYSKIFLVSNKHTPWNRKRTPEGINVLKSIVHLDIRKVLYGTQN